MPGHVPKQYLSINGRSVLHHTLSRICANPAVDGVVIGVSPQDVWWTKDRFSHPKILGTYEGGRERADTVLKGLKFLNTLNEVAPSDWALVHDAVRPCIVQQDIQNLVAEANANKTGAVLGKQLVDTLKKTDERGMVQETVNRSRLWRAFTPQIFRVKELTRAIEKSLDDGVHVTDESMAMELTGIYPIMVEGYLTNIKITISSDLELMELFLGEYQ